MKLKICKNDFSLQWNGTYNFALVDYPEINSWELEKIAKFVAYEKMYNMKTQIECENPVLQSLVCQYLDNNKVIYPFTPRDRKEARTFNVYGECVMSDYLSHTCTVETAKEILKSGKLLFATKAFGLAGKQLVNDKRNAAGDPADYFDYVMFGWSNTTSGYRLAMERLLERNPTEVDLEEAFIPGVSFHFRYETIVNQKGYVFDGYHAAKVKDEVLLDLSLCVCIIASQNKKEFEGIIPNYLKNRIHYLDYQNDGLVKWNDKVYEKVLELDGRDRTTTSIL
ncbi:phosphate ABC transporter ATPase [Streptococcus constellatus]|uniref:phosphate ABC transporter ATPase n=1 Tax=Streptococcus constellatus TaxID=76860 RepID=UPI00319DF677